MGSEIVTDDTLTCASNSGRWTPHLDGRSTPGRSNRKYESASKIGAACSGEKFRAPAILTKLLDGQKMTLKPITLPDDSPGYELSRSFRFERLLAGILPKGGTSPTGFEPVFQP